MKSKIIILVLVGLAIGLAGCAGESKPLIGGDNRIVGTQSINNLKAPKDKATTKPNKIDEDDDFFSDIYYN